MLIPDVRDSHPLYPKILAQYFSVDRPTWELLIYLPKEESSETAIQGINRILERYRMRDSYVTVQFGITLEEAVLFQGADYFITTRSRETVRCTCLADRYGTKLFYGTDDPIFDPPKSAKEGVR